VRPFRAKINYEGVSIMECLTCFNENNFMIRAVDRIGDTMGWHVMFECNRCATNSSMQYFGFKFEHELLDHLKRGKILKRKQNKWHLQEQYAFDWDNSIGGYDYTIKRKIKPMGDRWH
jgi:hypothetical protein